MKNILICVVILMLFCVGCKCEKPKIPEKSKPVIEIIVPAPVIFKVSEVGGQWEVIINNVAKEMVQKGQAEVRLHIGYCWYDGKLKGNKVVFTPDWHPGGRVSAGIWSKGKYLSSTLVEKNRTKMPPISDKNFEKTEIQKVKEDVQKKLSPAPIITVEPIVETKGQLKEVKTVSVPSEVGVVWDSLREIF